MKVLAQNYNYKNYNNYSSKPNFKGALDDDQALHTIKRLSKVNSEVFEGFNPEEINDVMFMLMLKYSALGAKMPAMMLVGKNDLSVLLGDKAKDYDINNKVGLCLAVSDVKAPVEKMDNIFEAKTFIFDVDELGKV